MVPAAETQPFAACFEDVEPWQCFTEAHRCPRCGGWDLCPDTPCAGYVSQDGARVVCTRRAEPLAPTPEATDPPPAPPEPPREEDDRTDPFLAHERSLSSTELLSLDSQATDWLVDERLPATGHSLLVGHAGSGKSRLARQLALAVARGVPWLGFRTLRGPVLSISVNEGLAELRRSYEQMGLTPSDPVHFLCSPAGSGVLARAREVIRTLAPALVIVDAAGPLLAAESRGWESEDASCSVLDRVLALGDETGSHVLVVHRLIGPGGEELSALLGSADRDIDTILLVTRSAGQRVVRSVQRRGANVEVALPEIPQVSPAVTPAVTSEQVLAFLRAATRPVTLREVVDAVPGQPGRILTALEQLRRRGRVLQTGSGGRDDPFRYTGCDPIGGVAPDPWLRKMRPWVRISR